MKPILFNTEMVQAILRGDKTQTRRIIKPQPSFIKCNVSKIYKTEKMQQVEILPPYKVGDILYVRETWKIQSMSNFNKRVKFLFKAELSGKLKEVYVSDARYNALMKYECKNGWQPSLFMPKEAARLFLEVTDVRVQKLQDITTHEANLEGAMNNPPAFSRAIMRDCHNQILSYAKASFAVIWDRTVKEKELDKKGWDANPWVWVIEFKKIDKSKEGE